MAACDVCRGEARLNQADLKRRAVLDDAQGKVATADAADHSACVHRVTLGGR
jgi:hypothetical protein